MPRAGSVFRSHAGAGSAVDDPGGGIDDPGGGDTDDLGSFDNLATSTTTSSKTSVTFVSSSLTTGFSLLFPFGQVSCGCGEFGWTTLVHGRLRYWVILLFVRHPAACGGGWTLE